MSNKNVKRAEKTPKMIAHQFFAAVGSVGLATSASMITHAATLNAHDIPVTQNQGDHIMIAICVTLVSAAIVYLTRPIPIKVVSNQPVGEVVQI